MENKTCTGCLESKSPDNFSLKRGRLNSRCKACVSAYYQQYYHGSEKRKESVKVAVRKYKDKNKFKILAKKYGCSEDVVANAFEQYGGMCHICKKVEAVALDHCHSSGLVRGALCHNHNVGLGWFRDNIDDLQQAIEYLAAVYPHSDKV